MSIPADYAERIYAGVLGKIIGVYLGRPFEGGQVIFDLVDTEHPLTSGAIALICEEGRVGCEHVTVQPVNRR